MQRTPRPTLFPYTTLFRSDFVAISREEREVLIDSVGCAGVPVGVLTAFVGLQEPHAAEGSVEIPGSADPDVVVERSEEHTSELQSHVNFVCRLLLEKKRQF